jgi:hypothetical protein
MVEHLDRWFHFAVTNVVTAKDGDRMSRYASGIAGALRAYGYPVVITKGE